MYTSSARSMGPEITGRLVTSGGAKNVAVNETGLVIVTVVAVLVDDATGPVQWEKHAPNLGIARTGTTEFAS